MKNSNAKNLNTEAEIDHIREEKGSQEIRLIKNIEIVIEVFKKASERLGRLGKRDWKEVLEQQSYILEELVAMQTNIDGKAQADFGFALNDFQFCLNRALEND